MLSQFKKKASDFEKEALVHLESLRNSALKMAKSQSEADDLVQETLLRAFKSFNRFNRGTNCRAWLSRIMTNIFINLYNRRKIAPEIVSYDQFGKYRDMMTTPQENHNQFDAEALILDSLDDDIRQLLRALPEDFRVAVILYDIQGFTYADVARIMNVKIGTVKSRISRARRKLEKGLREWGLANRYILEAKPA